MADPSPPTGLFLVYEPKDQEPAVDIVIIHGLKGHAYKTWTSPLMPDALVDLQSDGEMMASRRGQVLRSVTGLMKRASGKRGPSSASKPKTPVSTLFWPRDLLPEDCPNARILTYGYDTKITKYTSGSTNKNSVFSHSKDFLFALGRSHTKDRPLIFLAHSLGGIVVKEMLALSSTSPTDELCNIVSSTVAVIFLGTPHRGSPDLSALGAWAKSVLSGLRFQTNSAILDTLGLKTTDLERSQEAFSGLWFKHGFRVKTFQEGYPMTKINLGVLGNKVVPDTSSLIGDQREHAETLQANHMEMCRFSGREDPNFVKVVGELRSAYRTILTGTIDDPCTDQPVAVNSGMFNATSGQELTAQQAACLKSIQFSHMHRPRQLIEDPAPQTGHWLIKNETYSHWLLDRDLKERPCILWIKGKPGAGKSTIMKQAFRHAKSSLNGSEYCVAGVFVSAKGEPLEHSSIGIFRSLLHQLLPHYPVQLQEAVQTWTELDEEAIMSRHAEVIWREPVLKSLLNSILDYTSGKRTIIFIDGLDELDLPLVGSHVEFWGHLLTGENNGRVRVCLSSRHHPQTSLRSASELIAEDLNESDISTYVNQRLKARISRSESHWEPKLRNKMIDNARGIFLWVTLTMDSLLAKYDQGESLELLLRHIDSMPWELEHLFTNMVMSIRPESRRVALRVFQWALMSTAPLRLHQWHHVLAFIREPVPDSLKEWRRSVHYTESDSQLEREIKALSGGLLEVSASRPDEAPLEDEGNLSIRAGAGSLDLEQGETRIVKVIHQSVSEFFLEGGGFRLLDASAARNPVGSCHVTIAITCFNYISIQELDKLIDARRTYQKQESVSLSEWELSETGPVDSENESFLALEERNLAQDTTNSRRKLFDEHLIMIPTAETHTTVASWIAAGNIPTNPTTEAAPPIQYANSLLSSEYVSHQLEAWPSLLFYILSSLPTHLKVAKDVTSHSSTLFKCLDNTELWDRFVLLKEDIPRGTTFSEFINPRSRLMKALKARARRFEISRQPVSARGKPSLSSPAHERRSPSPVAVSRASSVASFASASSYGARQGNQSES